MQISLTLVGGLRDAEEPVLGRADDVVLRVRLHALRVPGTGRQRVLVVHADPHRMGARCWSGVHVYAESKKGKRGDITVDVDPEGLGLVHGEDKAAQLRHRGRQVLEICRLE